MNDPTPHEKTRIRQLEDASAHWEHKYANARQYNRNLEERIAALEARCAMLTAEVMHYTAGTAHPRVVELEAALLEAREWIETDTDALDECHKPYDLDNPIDVETAQEVDDRRTWLTRTASETASKAPE